MIKQASQDHAIPSERSHSATFGFFGLRVHPRISNTLLRLHYLHSGPMLPPSALSCRRTGGRSTLRCAPLRRISRTRRVRHPERVRTSVCGTPRPAAVPVRGAATRTPRCRRSTPHNPAPGSVAAGPAAAEAAMQMRTFPARHRWQSQRNQPS